MLVCLVLVALSLAAVGASSGPGAVVHVRASAFAKISTLVASRLASASVAIPESAPSEFGCVGRCHVQLLGGSVQNFTCASQSILPSSLGVNASFTNCVGKVNVKVEVKRSTFPAAHCHFTVVTDLSGLGLSTLIMFGKNASDNGLQLTSLVDAHLDAASVKIDGSFVCQLLGDLGKKIIAKQLVLAFNKEASKAVEKVLSSLLESLNIPVSLPIVEGVNANLQLSSPPNVTSSGVLISLVGTFMPSSCAPMETNSSDSADVSVLLSTCALNSAGVAFWDAGILQSGIFNTTFEGKNFSVKVNAASPPAFTSNSVVLNVSVGVYVDAVEMETYTVLALANYSIAVAAGNITGEIPSVKVQSMTLTNASGNTTDVSKYDAIATFIANAELPKFNALLAQGFRLPAVFGYITNEQVRPQGSLSLVVDADINKNA